MNSSIVNRGDGEESEPETTEEDPPVTPDDTPTVTSSDDIIENGV